MTSIKNNVVSLTKQATNGNRILVYGLGIFDAAVATVDLWLIAQML